MKIFLALAICIFLFSTNAYGQTGELNHRLIPSEIMENTEGILQVYSGGDTNPIALDKIIATSSDSSIIQILSITQNDNGFMTDVKIKAMREGTAKIALASSGFSSEEFPITVYRNSNTSAKLLIKTTPGIFSTSGPKEGYVTVELANNNEFPTKATEDTTLTLTTSDSNAIILENSKLIIKKGEYYAVEKFKTNQAGSAQIYASSESMQTVSSTVTVNTPVSSQTIQLYVYPKTINDFSASYAYAIVQLHDASGNPIQAKEDIPVTIKIFDTSSKGVNDPSGQTPLISADESLVIKKGSYWGYVPVVVSAGLPGTFDISAYAKGYLVSSSTQLSLVPSQLFDDNSANVDMLPILATGQKELVGVLHLDDNNDNPIIAKNNIQIEIDSSDPNTLSLDKVKLDKGSGVSLVFGNVGTSSNSVTLNVITKATQTIVPQIISPETSNTFQLVAEPLVPKVLSHTNFPLSLYMVQNGALVYSNEDLNPLISPQEFIQTESKILSKGQSLVLLDSNLLQEDSNTISVTTKNFVTNFSIDGLSSKPTTISLDHPDRILSNVKNTFSIELLDGQQLPVIADDDIEFKLISNDLSILNVPESVVIKKGSYYSLFEVDAKNAGKAELSVLTSEIQLSKFDIDVNSLTPEITLDSTQYVDPNFAFDAAITAQYHGNPLNNLKVNWNIQGAKIQNMDTVTDQEGKAKISMISENSNKITIQASVSGGIFSTVNVNKDITINPPLLPTTQSQFQKTIPNTDPLSMIGINPLFVIIPGAVAAGGIILKKKNMLDGISNKMNFGEKFTGIREKISELREK